MTLIKETWNTFLKTWDSTVRLSAWYVAIAVGSALAAYLKNGQAGSEFLAAIIQIVTALASIYLSVKIYKLAFSIEDGKPLIPITSRETWKIAAQIMLSVLAIMLPFFLCIGIVVVPFILAGRNIFGFSLGIFLAAAAIVSMFYFLAVRFSFAQTRIIDGTPSIKESFKYSWKITKNKFWAIFGRVMLGGVFFGLFVAAISIAAVLLVSMVSGVDIAGEMAKQNPSPAVSSISELIQGIIMAAILPLFYIFKIKLYRSVEKSVA